MPGDHDWSTTIASYFREERLRRVTELRNDCASPFALTRKTQGQTSYLHFWIVLQLCGNGQRGRELYLLPLLSSQTTAKYVFHHAGLKQGDACMHGKKVSLGMGIAIPPTKVYWTAIDQVCSYSAPWHPWEQSRKDPGPSYRFIFRHKGYYTERENILFPVSVIDKTRSNSSRLKQGSFGKAFWQLRPGITWILQEGGSLLGWRDGLDEISSIPIFYGSQKPSLQSSIADSLIPAMHSTMCSGTAYSLWWL